MQAVTSFHSGRIGRHMDPLCLSAPPPWQVQVTFEAGSFPASRAFVFYAWARNPVGEGERCIKPVEFVTPANFPPPRC
jgi:hypothetical protein